VVIGVADLSAAVQAYANLGFELHPTPASALAYNAADCLELVPTSARPGLQRIVVESDDLAADVQAMRARGIDIGAPVPDQGGQASRAELGPTTALPLQFVQPHGPAAARHPHVCAHPNQVARLERTYIVVPYLREVVETYARVLSLPVPPVQRGNVIKADMCIFDVGPVGIGVAQPAEAGPAASALERAGPGPFQVLYRTRSLAAGADWMRAHGLPPPARGTRNTGEQAMLVGPDQACGTYLALVGPD